MKTITTLDMTLLDVVSNATETNKPWEQIRYLEDAIELLGEDDIVVKAYHNCDKFFDHQMVKASLKMNVINKALNTFAPFDDEYYLPSVRPFTHSEVESMDYIEQLNARLLSLTDYETAYCAVGFDKVDKITPTSDATITALHSPQLAKYCGKRFISIWRDMIFKQRQDND